MRKFNENPIEFLDNFKKCKIAAIDRAFEGTASTIGTHQARMALKYVLLNDESVLEGKKSIPDKYKYISTKYGGREFIKLVNTKDTIHILSKFAMALFGVEKYSFCLKDNEYEKLKKQNIRDFSTRELIEFITFLSYKDHLNTYEYLKMNNDVSIRLLSLLIDYRYKKNMAKSLDNFEGILDSKNKIDEDIKNRFYNQYQTIDITYKEFD